MGCEHIMVIRIDRRTDKAPTVQSVLTEFGCSIKTRLGLHDTQDGACTDTGLLILQLCGGDGYADLESALNGIDGVKAKLVELD